MRSGSHSCGLSGRALLKTQQLTQGARIADGMAPNIVIEIEIGGGKLRFPREQAIGPTTQMSFRIVAPVARAAAVEANVSEVSGELLRPGHLTPVVNTIRNVVAREQIVNLRNTPGFIAELDAVAVTARQNVQEI